MAGGAEAYDHHARSHLVVSVRETTALKKRDAHDAEVVPRDRLSVEGWMCTPRLAGSRIFPLEDDRHARTDRAVSEWTKAYTRHRADAGEHPDSVEGLTIELPVDCRFHILPRWRGHVEGDHTRGLEAKLNLSNGAEASNRQQRGDQQQDGEGRLNDHEAVADRQRSRSCVGGLEGRPVDPGSTQHDAKRQDATDQGNRHTRDER